MAEIKLNDINSAMETFLKKADEVKLKKKDLMDNMPQLLQAIKMFDRLQELYNSVTDKDSSRAKNYFNLAQQIASINEGWQNAHQQISREAFLADREGVGSPNRLSKEESEQLRKLMQSSKLKDFVEFLDMESPQTYEKFKGIVMQEAESMVGTKVVQDALRDYYLATSHDISKSNLSLREWLSVKLADFVESINKDAEEESKDKTKGKPSSDDTLVQDEEERQEKVKTDQAVAEIVKTSGKIDSALRKKEPEKSQTKVKVKSKPWKAPKGTWMGDLVQLLKWAGYLAGGIAAVAGVTNILAEQIRKAIEYQKEVKDNLDKYIKDRNSDEDRASSNIAEDAVQGIRDAAAKKAELDKEVGMDFSSIMLPTSGLDKVESWTGSRSSYLGGLLREGVAATLDISPTRLATARAVANQSCATIQANTAAGRARVLSTDSYIDDPNNPLSPEAKYARGVEARRRQNALAYFVRPEWNVVRDAEQDLGVLGRVINKIPYGDDVYKWIAGFGAGLRNYLAPKTKGGKSIDELYKMSDSELEKYALEKFGDKWLDSWYYTGYTRDYGLDPRNAVYPEEQLYDAALGELIYTSKDRRFKSLRDAQKSGDSKKVYSALQETFKGTNHKVGTFEEEKDTIQDILDYKDWGSDSGFLYNASKRNEAYRPQTVVNNYYTTQFNSYELTDKTQDGAN